MADDVETRILQDLLRAILRVEREVRGALAGQAESLGMFDIARMKGQLEAYTALRLDLARRLEVLKAAGEEGRPEPPEGEDVWPSSREGVQ
jgi:hypothetical protein